MSGFQMITPTLLMRRIGLPDAPQLIDLRIPEDVAVNPTLIPGAFQCHYPEIQTLFRALQGKNCVAICHAGHKISQGAAAHLRAAGIPCEVLAGGMQAWLEEALPAVPIAALPQRPSTWVTRHRPKIDRIATPWLIRRFIDPTATFLYVPPDEVKGVAERYSAIPFDTLGAALSHMDGKCTFDAAIKTFGLAHTALNRLAEIVRAADTGNMQNIPQASGLLALSIGLSRQYKDDNAQLSAALPLYDGLYRWARDGFDETHDSTARTTA